MLINKKIIITVIIILSLYYNLPAQNSIKGWGRLDQTYKKTTTYSGWVYIFYKKYISTVDGERCPMYPSCSTYSKEAFSKFGFFLGFIMTCDRLTRCGNDLYRYPKITINGREYAYDPITYLVDKKNKKHIY